MKRATISILLFAFAMHCEGPSSTEVDDAASSEAEADAGDAAPAYPAPHPAAPTIKSAGGPVIATPRIVPIAFEGDALAPTIGSFSKALHGSSYWKATTSEYGVGDVDVSDLVVVPATDTTPGATIDDTDIQSFLVAHLDGAHAGFGTPDANTIYALFYPQGTSVQQYGHASCTAFSGYHGQITTGTIPLTYVVMPRCQTNGVVSGTDAVTSSAVHEIIEAATDPAVLTKPAFNIPDVDHAAYAVYPATELADMCGQEPASYYKDPELRVTVQRSWSNVLAAAGGSPCAPVLAGDVYFAAYPVFPDTVKANFTLTAISGLGIVQTKGVAVKLGESQTIEIDVVSSAPMEKALHLWANDYPALFGHAQELELTFDSTTAVNGDKRQLTIKRVHNDPVYLGTPFIVFAGPDIAHTNLVIGFAGQ